MSQHFTTPSGSLRGDMDHRVPPERVSLEIRRDKLLELLRDGSLCAADFRCVDCRSKHCVWQLMLSACGVADDSEP